MQDYRQEKHIKSNFSFTYWLSQIKYDSKPDLHQVQAASSAIQEPFPFNSNSKLSAPYIEF